MIGINRIFSLCNHDNQHINYDKTNVSHFVDDILHCLKNRWESGKIIQINKNAHLLRYCIKKSEYFY